MKCIKCEGSSSIVLRKKDNYCNNCFLFSTNHKFRACLGKNKIISRNDKVLICLSGGPGSTALLDLIYYGISLDIHKKLRVIPFVLHIIGLHSENRAGTIQKQCDKYNFHPYYVHISDYFCDKSELPNVECLPKENHVLNQEFMAILNSMPPSAYNDFLSKVKRSLYIKYARLLDCGYIFTGETTSTLAVNLLSNLAIGRGSQVENDIGFMDARDENVKILRPMKDITKEELDYYINIKELIPDKCCIDLKNDSLQAVIGSFVTDLQQNYQSTISAVCKTADKIGVSAEAPEEHKKCIICKSKLLKSNYNLSAFEATNFSRKISFGSEQSKIEPENNTLFPFINISLCYGCSRIYSEISYNSPLLQDFIHNISDKNVSS